MPKLYSAKELIKRLKKLGFTILKQANVTKKEIDEV